MDKLQKINLKHNYKFKYISEIKRNCDIIKFICPEHGEQEMKYINHLNSPTGCKICNNIIISQRNSKKRPIEKSRSIRLNNLNKKFNKKFKYLNLDNITDFNKELLDIECPEHGKFKMGYIRHLNHKTGCPICSYKINYPNIKNIEYLNNKNYITNNFIHNNILDTIAITKFFNVGIIKIHKILNNLKISYKKKIGGNSQLEQEVLTFIKSIYSGKIITNSRKIITPLELDIYIPEYNLAIEFNGLYYHSYGLNNITDKQADLKYQSTRHLNKTNLCEDKNINLLHIFENEWLDNNKREIWKSIIKNKLKINNNKIYARKTIIKEVSILDARIFLEENHIQGAGAIGPIRYGLYLNDTLVSIMTFGKPRFNKTIPFELIRLCSKINYTVVGGASRLFKYFRKYHPGEIISYANRRFAFKHKNIYKTLGLEEEEVTVPNMFYFKGTSELYSRHKFQKHKLINFEHYSKDKSALEIMINNGYRRIYDSGNLKFKTN